jgi:hypothetical protein
MAAPMRSAVDMCANPRHGPEYKLAYLLWAIRVDIALAAL